MKREPISIRCRVLTARMHVTAMIFVTLLPGAVHAYDIDFTSGTLTVSTTVASENITINCKANSVHVNGSDTGVACSGVMTLVVNGGSGNNTIDLFGVAALLTPTTVTVDAAGVSPWISCDCVDYPNVDIVRTEQARRQQVCISGTNAGCECYGDGDCQSGDCDDSGQSSVDPPTTVFFYEHVYNDEGRFFVKEMPQPGAVVTITVQWKDAQGADVGIPVEYLLTSDPPLPAEGDGLEYTLSTPELFRNVVLDSSLGNRNVILDGPFTPSVQHNAVFPECPANSVVPDFRLSPVGSEHLVELPNGSSTPEGRIVIFYSDGLNGPLVGLEVVHVHDEVPTDIPVAVGRQVPAPGPDYCKAVCLQNECSENQAPGVQLAYQRIEFPLDIWPIQPIEFPAEFQVLWFQSTGVEFHLASQDRLFNQTLKGWFRGKLQRPGLALASLRLMALKCPIPVEAAATSDDHATV